MADNAKLSVSVIVSESTDYSEPYLSPKLADYTSTPDEGYYWRIQADTGGTTIDTGMFASIDYMVIKNLDTTNFVTAQFDTAGNANTDVIVAAGKFTTHSDRDWETYRYQ